MPTLATFTPKIRYENISVGQVSRTLVSGGLKWVNCIGLNNDEITQVLSEIKEVPDFLIEDCTTVQRPKMDEFAKIISIIFKMTRYRSNMRNTQLNMIVGKNYIITFAKDNHQAFDEIKERIKKQKKLVLELGVGYLVYVVLESIINSYFPIVEKIEERIEDAEDRLLEDTGPKYVNQILGLRKATLRMRRNIYPEKEILNSLGRDRHKHIEEGSMVYFRDSYSDLISLSDRIDFQREHLSSLMEIYTSNMSNNLNNVMKTLTVIASLILVPGLIAGIYGMNVMNLPLADRENGFIVIIALILSIFAVMLAAFRAKRYI